MNRSARETFFSTLAARQPQPHTELQYSSVFELLCAVLLSAQATDVSVNKATSELFQVANTPQKMLNLGLLGLEQSIRSIGLYHSKARHLIKTCQLLLEQHQGRVPNACDALQSLSGIGRKSANVILNVAFGAPTVAVDTHVFRVAKRTGLATGNSVLAVEKQLLKRVPKHYLPQAHHWLVLHGRYVCLARKPRCMACAVQHCCDFYNTCQPNPA